MTDRLKCPMCKKETQRIEVTGLKPKIVFICTNPNCKETGSFNEDGTRIS